MQWILQDVPIGRNIQNIRMKKNMTQAEVVGQLQLMGAVCPEVHLLILNRAEET